MKKLVVLESLRKFFGIFFLSTLFNTVSSAALCRRMLEFNPGQLRLWHQKQTLQTLGQISSTYAISHQQSARSHLQRLYLIHILPDLIQEGQISSTVGEISSRKALYHPRFARYHPRRLDLIHNRLDLLMEARVFWGASSCVNATLGVQVTLCTPQSNKVQVYNNHPLQ